MTIRIWWRPSRLGQADPVGMQVRRVNQVLPITAEVVEGENGAPFVLAAVVAKTLKCRTDGMTRP
ncbi:hypothetical protein [Nocardia sp. NPDC004260]